MLALLLGSMTPVFVLYAPKLLEIYREQMDSSKYSSNHSGSNKTNNITNLNSGNRGDTIDTASKFASNIQTVGDRPNSVRANYKNQSKLSAVSAVSGLSEDGQDANCEHDIVDVELVPSSEVAGDEEFAASAMHMDDGTMHEIFFSKNSNGIVNPDRPVPEAILPMKQVNTRASSDSKKIKQLSSESKSPSRRNSSHPTSELSAALQPLSGDDSLPTLETDPGIVNITRSPMQLTRRASATLHLSQTPTSATRRLKQQQQLEQAESKTLNKQLSAGRTGLGQTVSSEQRYSPLINLRSLQPGKPVSPPSPAHTRQTSTSSESPSLGRPFERPVPPPANMVSKLDVESEEGGRLSIAADNYVV
eukprot:gb/GEZN01007608.1/.p1 GENE.gb/GEZN01007608.1/~~gb/GEZN01007608.1/.p1  ORF type:complete len:362 (+),score=37.35 gb/GEZN01007608.1/:3-1088(+)